MTASPEQLQLMLYDGAVRFATQARDAIERGDIEGSYNLLTRVQKIVNEMQSGLQLEVAPELCTRMSALYDFVLSKLVAANIHKDVSAVDDALKVLKHQRETWAILTDRVQQVRASHDQPVPADEVADAAPGQATLSIEG